MAVKPAKPLKYHILIIDDGKETKQILLKKDLYSLGRGHKCDIRLHSQFVSRHHATLVKRLRDDGNVYYRIVDGDNKGKASVNGIIVNGRKVSFHELKDGDKIVFGPQVSAIYQFRQYDIFPTIPPDDPFDITLIDPAMMNGTEEISENTENFSDRES